MTDVVSRFFREIYCNADGTFNLGHKAQSVAKYGEEQTRQWENFNRQEVEEEREKAEREEALKKIQDEYRTKFAANKGKSKLIRRLNPELDVKSMTPALLTEFRQVGLDSEELLSQGFKELDDF